MHEAQTDVLALIAAWALITLTNSATAVSYGSMSTAWKNPTRLL